MNRLTIGLVLGVIAGVPVGAAIHSRYVLPDASVSPASSLADQVDAPLKRPELPPMPPMAPEEREKFIAAMCEVKEISTHQLICADREYKRELATISIKQFVGDKRAKKVENIKTTFNQDGTLTVGALLSYEDGQQESCDFVMIAEPGKQNGTRGLQIDPKSRVCAPAMKSN